MTGVIPVTVKDLICHSKSEPSDIQPESLQLPNTREPKIMMDLRTKLIVILAAQGCGADTKNTAGRRFQKQASHQQSETQRTITGFQRL